MPVGAASLASLFGAHSASLEDCELPTICDAMRRSGSRPRKSTLAVVSVRRAIVISREGYAPLARVCDILRR